MLFMFIIYDDDDDDDCDMCNVCLREEGNKN